MKVEDGTGLSLDKQEMLMIVLLICQKLVTIYFIISMASHIYKIGLQT